MFTKKFYPRLSWIIRLSCSSRSLRKFNLLSLTTELRMLRVSLRFTLPKIRLKGWGVFASLLKITWFWKTLWWNFIVSYALITALVRSTWFELITLFTYSPINFFCNGLIALSPYSLIAFSVETLSLIPPYTSTKSASRNELSTPVP